MPSEQNKICHCRFQNCLNVGVYSIVNIHDLYFTLKLPHNKKMKTKYSKEISMQFLKKANLEAQDKTKKINFEHMIPLVMPN